MTEWIISSSVLLAVIAVLRSALRLQHALWAPVLTRPLLPVRSGVSSVSAMNAVPEAALPSGVPGHAFAAPERVTPE